MSSLASPLAVTVQRFGDSPALIAPHTELSWRDVGRLAASIAADFRAQGVMEGDRVCLTGANSMEYVLMVLGLIEARAVVCPLSARLPHHAQQTLVTRLQARRVDVESVDLEQYQTDTSHGLSVEWAIDRPATILFTSGSTGESKAVALSVGNHYYSAQGANENIPFGAGHRWLVTLPFYHVGGLAIIFRSILNGGTMAIPESGYDLVEAINRLDATHLSLVPTQLHRLLQAEKSLTFVMPRLAAVLIGGSSTSPLLIDASLEAGLPIHTSYGLTEMASQVCTTKASDPAPKLFTSGRVLNNRELRLAPDDEILVRGRTRFLGYYIDGGLQTPVDAEGWFATGDIGRLDPDGYLMVRGRKDNMFISGGENIHPEEIEMTLGRLPEVAAVVVVSVPDDEFGARPVAFVKAAEDAPFEEARYIVFLERFLPRFKIPDHFFPWPAETGDTMKYDRRWFSQRAAVLTQKSKE
ncbi:MAG: o-succinylbenzoate--CoA ligase [candidate division Zixibacteria bacterium]|nr:o-succinylbenzoate--CoA ligase [candidate division Zixibacteria bacterium]